jgi:hypothetical protein
MDVMHPSPDFEIKMMSLTDVARGYGINVRTLRKIIAPILRKLKLTKRLRLLAVWQVQMIVDFIELPPELRAKFT